MSASACLLLRGAAAVRVGACWARGAGPPQRLRVGGFGPASERNASGPGGPRWALARPCVPAASSSTSSLASGSSSPPPVAVGPSGDRLLREVEAGMGTLLGTGPLVPPPSPLVIVISGPSGVGKDAVIRRLQDVRPQLHFVVTTTTRPMRPTEVHGVDYYFVSLAEFEALRSAGELLEHALVYGDYKGIPKQQVRSALARRTDVVLRVDVQGAARIRELLPEAVSIFIAAESERALVRRLIARKTETPDKLAVRAATARDEVARYTEFDYVVVNADGMMEETVQQLCAIIDAEKSRVRPRNALDRLGSSAAA